MAFLIFPLRKSFLQVSWLHYKGRIENILILAFPCGNNSWKVYSLLHKQQNKRVQKMPIIVTNNKLFGEGLYQIIEIKHATSSKNKDGNYIIYYYYICEKILTLSFLQSATFRFQCYF